MLSLSFSYLRAHMSLSMRSDLSSLSSSTGTWVTFGGQITDEVRADGFISSVKAQELKPSV